MNPAASTMRALHVWFSTKGRRPVLVEEIKAAVLANIAAIATRIGVRIVEMEAIEDHVHLLLELRQNQKLSTVMHDLKGATARRVFVRFPELPLDMKSHSLWQRGYGWRLVPPEQIETVRRYIASQSDKPLRHE
jgi:putative transposase